jgi:hypothetical protein
MRDASAAQKPPLNRLHVWWARRPLTVSRDTGIVARCFQDGETSAVGYYRLSDGGPLPSLTTLGTTLDGQSTVNVLSEQRTELENRFADAGRQRHLREAKAAEDHRKAQLSSLTEEIRQLLVEAAYVELALAANRDLFDDALPLDFSEQAYQRLKRHKVPFSGAIKLVGTGLPKPRPDDSLYLRLRESKKDVLTRRFDAIRGKLIDRLGELMEARKKMEKSGLGAEAGGAVRLQLVGVGGKGKA